MIFTSTTGSSARRHVSKHLSRLTVGLGMAAIVALSAFAAQSPNIINTYVGGATPPTAPLSADLPGPTAAVKDAAGNTYIAAPTSSYIFKLSSDGSTLSVYTGQGYGGYGGDGGPAAAAVVSNPNAIVFDSKGNLFFADYGNSRIRRVDATTGSITTYAGSGQKCAHSTNVCGDGGPATQASLNLPEALALDSAGNLYIADANDNRIRKVDATTQNISTVAGSGNVCANPTTACGDGGAATAANLDFPEGLAVDSSNNIYIADTYDHRIRIVSAATGIISAFAGNGGACLDPTRACGDGQLAVNANLRRPQGVWVDSSNNVYIADTQDHRLRFVNASTQIINTMAGTGHQGFAGDGQQATAAQLNVPVGVFVDGSGTVTIADTGNQRIRQINASTGVISSIAGGGNGGDGGPALSATLAGPYGVAEDASGNIYVVDQFNNRVRKVTSPLSNGTITTIAGTGIIGFSGDGGSALNATFNQPTTVAIDGAGNLYIADVNNFVIRKIDTAGNISTVAGTPGQTCFPSTAKCGDGGPATSALFAYPISATVDSAGNLYIADYYGYRVRKVTASTGIISTVAGTGQSGYKGDGGPATSALLNHPSSLALDNAGNLYISDQYNMHIRKVNSSGTISNYALTGKAALTGDGGPATSGSMWNPLALAIDPSNNVFVSGGNDNTVQIISAATGIWGTVAGNKTMASVGGFSGDGGPAQQARLANAGASVDGQGNLYIADAGNNRVRYVQLAPALSVPAAPLNFGSWPLNTKSTAKVDAITSSGGLDLNLSSITFTGTNAGDFSQTNTCPGIPGLLGPNVTCNVSVFFTPSGYGKRTATLTFTDNAGNSPQTVSLSGSGPDFSISANPTSLTITHGNAGSSTLTLTPSGQFNQTISLTFTGCPSNATCSITPNSVTLDGIHAATAILNVQTASNTPAGNYKVTATGTFSPLRHPAAVNVTVQ